MVYSDVRRGHKSGQTWLAVSKMERWALIEFFWKVYSSFTMPWRFCSLLVLAVILQYLVALVVARRFTLQTRTVGFSPNPSKQVRARKFVLRFLLSALALALVPVLSVALGWLQINMLVIYAVRGGYDGAQSVTVYASEVMVNRLEISVPRSCKLERESQATLIEVDPDKGTHRIEVKSFLAPQNLTIVCKDTGRLEKRNFVIEEQTEGPYFLTELQDYTLLIYLSGGLTWILGAIVALLHSWSRSRSR